VLASSLPGRIQSPVSAAVGAEPSDGLGGGVASRSRFAASVRPQLAMNAARITTKIARIVCAATSDGDVELRGDEMQEQRQQFTSHH
jgi:hypothetical protein